MDEQLSNWVAVERKWISDLSPVGRLVFLEALFRARYNGNRLHPSTGEVLELGQFWFGRKELAKRCGCTEKQVRTAVKILEKGGLIKAIKSTPEGTSAFIGDLRWILAGTGPIKGQQRATNIQEPKPIEPKQEEIICSTSRAILEFLNSESGSSFRTNKPSANLRIIEARMKDFPHLTEKDFTDVVRLKCQQWKDDPKMRMYLRPETLFRASKFEGYLSEVMAERATADKYSELFA